MHLLTHERLARVCNKYMQIDYALTFPHKCLVVKYIFFSNFKCFVDILLSQASKYILKNRRRFCTFYTAHYVKLLKKRPINATVVYLFSLIYLHLHVSVVIQPSSGLSILKSTVSYSVCIHPRQSFYNVLSKSKIIMLFVKKFKVMSKCPVWMYRMSAIRYAHTGHSN